MSYEPKNFTASATLGLSDVDAPITISAAAGLTLTLPASTGRGAFYDIMVLTTVTSNSVIIRVANSVDVMTGVAVVATDNAADAVIAFETAASSDTITMNGTTTGGIRGDRIFLRDVALGFWQVQATMAATGTEVTPFSATV